MDNIEEFRLVVKRKKEKEMKEEFNRIGDNLYYDQIFDEHNDYPIEKRTLIMTKKIFQECYKEWIKAEKVDVGSDTPEVSDTSNLQNRIKIEEAIKWLDSLLDTIGKQEYISLWHYEQALVEIKELLENQSEINNTIHLCDSCQKVYPECDSTAKEVIFGTGVGNDNICACACYEPAVQPEQKKGKWIEYDPGIKITSYKCSECGRVVRDDTGYNVAEDYPFCHCGADMRNEE